MAKKASDEYEADNLEEVAKAIESNGQPATKPRKRRLISPTTTLGAAADVEAILMGLDPADAMIVLRFVTDAFQRRQMAKAVVPFVPSDQH